MTKKYNDFPIEECFRVAKEKIEEGWTIYQKFTCEKCSSRQTMETPNQFFATGKCEECQHITNLRLRGCNYMAIGKIL